MNSYDELARYGRESMAQRHRQADRYRQFRAARQAQRAHGGPHGFGYGLRARLARLLRAAARRLEPSRESDPAPI